MIKQNLHENSVQSSNVAMLMKAPLVLMPRWRQWRRQRGADGARALCFSPSTHCTTACVVTRMMSFNGNGQGHLLRMLTANEK